MNHQRINVYDKQKQGCGQRVMPEQLTDGISEPLGPHSAVASTTGHITIQIENPQSEDHTPLPPAQISAAFDAVEKHAKMKSSSPIRDDDAPVPSDQIAATFSHSTCEQSLGEVGISSTCPTPLPVLLPPSTGDQNELGCPILRATLVPDEPEVPVCNAVVVQSTSVLEQNGGTTTGSSPPDLEATKTKRCHWKCFVVVCLLAIIGVSLIMIFFSICTKF